MKTEGTIKRMFWLGGWTIAGLAMYGTTLSATVVKVDEFPLVVLGNPTDPWANGHVGLAMVAADNIAVLRYSGDGQNIAAVSCHFATDIAIGLPGTIIAYSIADPVNLTLANLSSNPSCQLAGTVSTDVVMPGGLQVYKFSSTNLFPSSFATTSQAIGAIAFSYQPAAGETLILMTTRQDYGSQPVDYTLSALGFQDIDGAFPSYGAVEITTGSQTPGLWKGPAGGSWGANGNWDDGAVPSAGTALVFGPAGAGGLVHLDAVRTVSNSITLGDGASGAYNLAAGSAGRLNLTSSVTISATGSQQISAPIQGTGALIKTAAGTLTLGGENTYSGGASVIEGRLIVAHANALGTGGLSLANTASVALHADLGQVVQLNSLDLSAGSQLDIANNAIVVHSTATDNSLRNALWQKILAGQNGVDANSLTQWNGLGIVSGSARTNNLSRSLNLYTVGIIANHDLDANYQYNATNGWLNGMFTGVGPDDVLIRYTYSGDSNLDGSITIVDYVAIDSTYGGTAVNHGWVSGDFNNDGSIGIEDYVAIDTAYAFQTGSLSQTLLNQRRQMFGAGYVAQLQAIVAGFSAVPEPTMIALLALGSLGLLSRRRPRA